MAVLFLGGKAYIVFIVAIVANLIMFVVRLLIVRNLVNLMLKPYFKQVVLPVLIIVLLSVIPSIFIHFILPQQIVFTGISILLSVVISCFCMYFVGLERVMRQKVKIVLFDKLNKIF